MLPKQYLKTALTATLAITAISSSAAGARPHHDPAQRLYVNPSTGYATPVLTAHRDATRTDRKFYVNPDTGFAYPEQASEGSPPMGSQPDAPQPAVDTRPADGFDLPSAAIGAAAGGLLLILITATIGVARRRRSPLQRR